LAYSGGRTPCQGNVGLPPNQFLFFGRKTLPRRNGPPGDMAPAAVEQSWKHTTGRPHPGFDASRDCPCFNLPRGCISARRWALPAPPPLSLFHSLAKGGRQEMPSSPPMDTSLLSPTSAQSFESPPPPGFMSLSPPFRPFSSLGFYGLFSCSPNIKLVDNTSGPMVWSLRSFQVFGRCCCISLVYEGPSFDSMSHSFPYFNKVGPILFCDREVNAISG